MIVYVHTQSDSPVSGMAVLDIDHAKPKLPTVGDIIRTAVQQLGPNVLAPEHYALVVSGHICEHEYTPLHLHELQRLVLVPREEVKE